MQQAKRKRLETAGWHAGSAAEFVGLTDDESAYVELRVRLSEALKTRRVASRLSQKDVATAIASSQSRVAKMEAADPSVSLDLLIRGLIALGVSLTELGTITAFAKTDAATIQNSATVNSRPIRKGLKDRKRNRKRSG